mgnify:CR=1 FL=1
MNERIKKLILEATTEEHDGFLYFDKKKFAELIVEEVLSLQNRHGNIKPKAVKLHFGVLDE